MVTNKLTLVTHNTTEFQRVPGLKVEDWKGATSVPPAALACADGGQTICINSWRLLVSPLGIEPRTNRLRERLVPVRRGPSDIIPLVSPDVRG